MRLLMGSVTSGFLLLVVVVVLSLVLGDDLGASCGLLFLQLLDLRVPESLDSIGWAWQLANSVGDLASANKRNDNCAADNKGQNKSVDTVPGWGPTTLASAAVGVVEEVEGKELGDEGVFNGQEKGRPGNSGGNDTNGIASVPVSTTKCGPLKTPMDGAKERDDLLHVRGTRVGE